MIYVSYAGHVFNYVPCFQDIRDLIEKNRECSVYFYGMEGDFNSSDNLSLKIITTTKEQIDYLTRITPIFSKEVNVSFLYDCCIIKVPLNRMIYSLLIAVLSFFRYAKECPYFIKFCLTIMDAKGDTFESLITAILLDHMYKPDNLGGFAGSMSGHSYFMMGIIKKPRLLANNTVPAMLAWPLKDMFIGMEGEWKMGSVHGSDYIYNKIVILDEWVKELEDVLPLLGEDMDKDVDIIHPIVTNIIKEGVRLNE